MRLRDSLATIIGVEIRRLRNEKGISLKEFESLDGSIDRHSLSRIESAEKLPTIETLFKICKLLDTDLGDFFTRVEKAIKKANQSDFDF